MVRDQHISFAALRSLFVVCGVAACVFLGRSAQAQDLNQALEQYRAKQYAAAAVGFYQVLRTDAEADRRDQAQIYLAETLSKLNLHLPAYYYYMDLFQLGRTNRYYLNSVEGLLSVQRKLRDPVIVPALIDANLDPDGFANLDPQRIARINYMVGELSFRRGRLEDARAFFAYVPEESLRFVSAQVLLGLVEIRAGNASKALEHFKKAIDSVPEDARIPEHRSARGLAILGAARTAYGAGQYADATRYYRSVERYSEHWFSALLENAWAYVQQGDYGRALGEIESVKSPYFAKRHIPEAYVIEATTYFVLCQWDQVRQAVTAYQGRYQAMRATLEAYLAQERPSADVYQHLIAGGDTHFDLEIAREVRRLKRFRDFHFLIEHLDWERQHAGAMAGWKQAGLLADVTDIIAEQHKRLVSAVGTWVQKQLLFRLDMLKNFENQINILDFELTDAERQWLEQGREILKGRRAQLPRPEIPNDQWQHWGFAKEFWKDELGYYAHSVRSECL